MTYTFPWIVKRRNHVPTHPSGNPMTYGAIAGLEKPISRLIMGTLIYTPTDLPFCFAMLDHFVSLGGTAIDTAHVYGGGASERAIGAWLAARGNRERIVLIGK